MMSEASLLRGAGSKPLMLILSLLLGMGCDHHAPAQGNSNSQVIIRPPDILTKPGRIVIPDRCPTTDELLTDAPEGSFIPAGSSVQSTRKHCQAALHPFAGAKGSRIRLTLMRWTGTVAAAIRVLDLAGEVLDSLGNGGSGSALRVTLPRSGEYFVRLDPEDPEAEENDYQIGLSCVEGCDIEYTRYPTVFLHGMAGTDAYLDTLDYFYHLHDFLASYGYLVFMPEADAFASPPTRAAQWQEFLDELEEQGQGRRFNLVAHSQGGLDARYLISALKDTRPASLITVATPHRGSAVADLANWILDRSQFAQSLVDDVLSALSEMVGLGEAEACAQIASLTTNAMYEFNSVVANRPYVYYSSWAGHSCGALEFGCQDDWNGEIVFPLLAPTYRIIQMVEGDNDGMVSVESARWGEFMGELPADHMDEVGQLADNENQVFDHLEFYLSELRRLASLGY